MKKNKILIIVLILIIILMGAYIVYDKYTENNSTKGNGTKKETTTEETESFTALDVNSNEVKNLYNSIDVFNDTGLQYSDYYGYLYRQDHLTETQMADDVKVFVGITNALKECTDCEYTDSSGNPKIKISESMVAKEIKQVFGDIKFENTNTKPVYFCGNKPGYVYSDGNYTFTFPACGGMGGKPLKNYQTSIIKAEKTSKELNIYVKFIYVTVYTDNEIQNCVSWYPSDVQCIVSSNIYKDIFGQEYITTSTDDLWNSSNSQNSEDLLSSDTVSKYQDSLYTYKLHFENENGSYVFKNIEKQ